MNRMYRQQVELLLRIIPTLEEVDSFAIHGGTAINLYILDLPRYSVDIDVTYTPIKPRDESFADIHKNLSIIKEKVKTVVPDIVITEKPNKIYCTRKGVMVKIEVSGTKRGLIDPATIRPLCDAAQNEFETTNKAKIVSLSQLYGGKIAAALDRQHPRDLFDVKLMFDFINSNLSLQDKEFLIAFESGEELSRYNEYQEYLRFPSVQWKMQNISKLKRINPAKLRKSIEKLEDFLL